MHYSLCKAIWQPSTAEYKIQPFSVLIFNTCKCTFRGGYAMWLHRCVSQDGGWDKGVARSSSIKLISRILLRTHWPAKPAEKMAKLYINDLWIGNYFHHKKRCLQNLLFSNYHQIVFFVWPFRLGTKFQYMGNEVCHIVLKASRSYTQKFLGHCRY